MPEANQRQPRNRLIETITRLQENQHQWQPVFGRRWLTEGQMRRLYQGAPVTEATEAGQPGPNDHILEENRSADAGTFRFTTHQRSLLQRLYGSGDEGPVVNGTRLPRTGHSEWEGTSALEIMFDASRSSSQRRREFSLLPSMLDITTRYHTVPDQDVTYTLEWDGRATLLVARQQLFRVRASAATMTAPAVGHGHAIMELMRSIEEALWHGRGSQMTFMGRVQAAQTTGVPINRLAPIPLFTMLPISQEYTDTNEIEVSMRFAPQWTIV